MVHKKEERVMAKVETGLVFVATQNGRQDDE